MQGLSRFVLAFVIIASAIAGEIGAQAVEELRVSYRPVAVFNERLYGDLMVGPRAVTYDAKRKEIWVAEAGRSVVGVYQGNGAELFSFSSEKYLQDPASIAVSPDGDLAVVAGTRRSVARFNYRGEYEGDIDLEKMNEKPDLVAVEYDREGNLFVADNASSEILAYGPTGRLRFRFGSNGVGEGQFQAISAVAVGDDGSIYVADSRSIAVQVFDWQGNFVRGWGEHAMGKESFSLPAGIAVDSKGRVIVADQIRHSVKVFSPDGRLLANLGGFGSAIGELMSPSDVTVDEEDRIIVTEKAGSRVQIFEIVEIDR